MRGGKGVTGEAEVVSLVGGGSGRDSASRCGRGGETLLPLLQLRNNACDACLSR